MLGPRRLANASHQHHGKQQNDHESGDIEAKMPPRRKDVLPRQILQPQRQISRRQPLRIEVYPQPVQQIHAMRRESDRHAHVRKRVLENEIPADDPGDQLAQRRVSIGVRRSCDRDHAGKLGVAKPGQRTHNSNQNERECKRGTRPGPPRHRATGVVQPADSQVDDGRALPVGDLRWIPADCCTNHGEDPPNRSPPRCRAPSVKPGPGSCGASSPVVPTRRSICRST